MRADKINPFNFLSFDRLDLIVKYLYIDSIEKKHNQSFILKLYKKYIFSHFGKNKQTNKDIEKQLDKFNNLIESIKKNDFKKDYLIKVDTKGRILNGSHIACIAFYFKKNIYYNINEKNSYVRNLDWFKDKKFSKKEINFIIHKYIELTYKKTFFFVIWPKGIRYFSQIRQLIEKKYPIIYNRKINLTEKEFSNLLYQVYGYEFNEGTYKILPDKINEMKKHKKEFILLLVEIKNQKNYKIDRNGKKTKVYNMEAISLKKEIRKKFETHNIHSIVHSTDNPKHNLFLNNIFFTKTMENLKRFSNIYSKKFLIELKDFKKFLQKEKIDPKNIVISGSSVLETLCLRKANDIDFVILEEENKDKKISFGKYDLHNKKVSRDNIFNPNNYYYFNGLKFLYQDIVLKYKIESKRDKDKSDIYLLKKGKYSDVENIYEKIFFYKNLFIFKTKSKIYKILVFLKLDNYLKLLLKKIGRI